MKRTPLTYLWKSCHISTWPSSTLKWPPWNLYFIDSPKDCHEFLWKYFTVILSAFLEINTLIQSDFELKTRLDRAIDYYLVVLTRYDKFSALKEIGTIFSRRNTHFALLVITECFCYSSVMAQSRLLSSVQLYFQYFGKYVYTLPRTAWSAENSTIPNEYGSAPAPMIDSCVTALVQRDKGLCVR